jgi:hypothetical protein
MPFWHERASLKREWNERFKGPRVPKKSQFTHERVEYNVFLFDESLKGSKSLKIFKISLTFRFDKLWHLSKSVHIWENSQILTVSNKKLIFSEWVLLCLRFICIVAIRIRVTAFLGGRMFLNINKIIEIICYNLCPHNNSVKSKYLLSAVSNCDSLLNTMNRIVLKYR